MSSITICRALVFLASIRAGRLAAMRAFSAVLLLGVLTSPAVRAGDRILGSWGVSPVEGGGGGGLSPWAVISGTGSAGQTGGAAFFSRLHTRGGFDLKVAGAGVGIDDRLELSMARWSFRLGDAAPGASIHVDVLGAKLRVVGNALYDQDAWMPQISLGAQFKRNEDFSVPQSLGARDDSGVDVYLSATKVWLGAAAGHNLLANANLRATRANQFGLLGFGGDRGNAYKLLPEASVGLMLRDNLIAGAEWRAKPDNLSLSREEEAFDVFVAWFPYRHFNLTAAWLDMGNIANQPHQNAWYVSVQAAF